MTTQEGVCVNTVTWQPNLARLGLFFSPKQEVTENCQSLWLGSSVLLLAFLPVCRMYVDH